MTRPSPSRSWYEPGASGMLPDSGRATMPHCRGREQAVRAEKRVAGCYVFRNAGPVSGANTSDSEADNPEEWRPGCHPPADEESLPRTGEAHMLRLQAPLPDQYTLASEDELVSRIAGAKQALGERLLILGHHYQRDEVICWADKIGDSFKLARFAADNHQATDIVFCGVHFMAESADVLTADHQRVILPDLNAGCSMADMADIDQVEEAWDEIGGITAVDRVVPITYMNSSAALKAFVGRNGGAVCTSSNARAVLEWALARRDKVLFFPDQHLGRNTGFTMGFGEADMRVWNPHADDGGLEARDL